MVGSQYLDNHYHVTRYMELYSHGYSWRVGRNDLAFCTLLFAAEVKQMRNGNTLIANWGGHEKHLKAPLMVEIDKNNNRVWSFEGNELFRYISSISCIDKW